MITSLFILGPILLILFAVIIGYLYFARLRRQAMQDAARELGLLWRSDDPTAPGEILGVLDGFPVSVRVGPLGVAGVSTNSTMVEVVLPIPLPFQGEIVPLDRVQRARRGLARLINPEELASEVPLGDAFLLRTNDPQQGNACFDEDALLYLKRFAENAEDILILPTRLRWYRYDDAVQNGRVPDALRGGIALADHFRRQRTKRTLATARSKPPPE